MTRAATRLSQVAVAAVLVAVGVTLGLMTLGDRILAMRFESALGPALLAEYRGEGPMSPALIAAFEREYSGWENRAVPIVGLLAGLAAGALVGALAGWRLLRPLGRLAATAARISDGDLSARVGAGASGIVEIDRFARDFDEMASTIERAELERRESSAAIAHELRTPLTVLTGRLNGMLDGIFPADRDGLAALLAQTELLARIVDDLRLLTLAETQQLDLHLAPCDLAEQARTVIAAQDIGPGAPPIRAELGPAPVRCDAMRLRQALQALLTNAARHGGGEITVATGVRAGVPFLSVMDRGPGLTPDEAAAAFDRFWRADRSRNRDSGGSGLGLSVVQAIARAHGARAAYDDRPGGGAVFSIRFPPAAA